MPWVKLDDAFPEHAKIERAGEAAAWMFVCGLCYCSRALTDGFISAARMRRLTTGRYPEKTASRLVSVGLWDRVEGGFAVHDYLDFQPPSIDVKAKRRANAERQARHRARRSHAHSNALRQPLVTPSVTPSPRAQTRAGSGRDNSIQGAGTSLTRDLVAEACMILSAVERWEVDEVGVENAAATEPGGDLIRACHLAASWGSDPSWTMGPAASVRAALRKLAEEGKPDEPGSKASLKARDAAALERWVPSA